MVNKKTETTKEEAIKILQADQEKNIKECQEEIQAVLDKYGCALDYRPQISIVQAV